MAEVLACSKACGRLSGVELNDEGACLCQGFSAAAVSTLMRKAFTIEGSSFARIPAVGQDLQTGTLSGAQADSAALQRDGPQRSSSTQGSNPIAQAFQQLSSDLQCGHLTAAQQDCSNILQDFQNQTSQMQRPGHHHRLHSGDGQESSNDSIAQILARLAQDLQSGNLTAAQPAYTSLQQDLQQVALSNGALDGVPPSPVNPTA